MGWLLGTWMGLAFAAPAVDPCSPEQVRGQNEDKTLLNAFVLESGYGSGKTQGEALEIARRNAREGLFTQLGCAGREFGADARCDLVLSKAETWTGNSRQDRRKLWEACATAALPRSEFDRLEADAQALQADLARVARELAAVGPKARLAFMAPVWRDGCAVGAAGASLLQGLERQLGALPADQGLTLLVGAGHTLQGDDRRVLLELSQSRGQVEVVASLVEPRGCTKRMVGQGLAFPSYLYGLATASCAQDSLTGITAYGVCTPDLRVDVQVPSRSGVICPGEVVTPEIQVSAPSRVQVFSVDSAGRAWLIFPAEGQSDLVRDSLRLETMDAVYQEGAGQDHLVALAVPQGQSFGLTEGWSGWCEVPGGWREDLRPSHGAGGRSNFLIPQPGSPMCKDGPRAQWEHVAAPRCGR